MRYVKYFMLVLAFCADGILTKTKGKSNRVLVQYGGSEDDAIAFGTSLGLRFKRKVLSRYEFTQPSSGAVEVHVNDLKKSYPQLISIEDEYYLDRYKKVVTVNDAQWTNQWHLRTSQSPSMNVYNAWEKGYTGNGITIAIVDDGIDIDHSDLMDNYNAALSYDVIYNSLDPSHVDAGDGHGSKCAGVAGAVKNTNCVIGVAFEASIPAIRLLDENYGATASDEAIALTHQLSSIDIYSNSWGPSDDGESFSGMSSVQVEALQKGVTEGRGGKGVIYTWASGNGGAYDDDCNADGYTSSIYTIAIAAMSETTAPTWYSEHCTAILATTYSGDDPNVAKISTTGPANTCVNDFSGTSSACPVASGICALTLQANSALTWRDMQHMIVEYSTTSGFHTNASFYTNAAGKTVSHWFGFGLMDAESMVDNAPSWLTVPSSTSCSSPVINLDSTSNGASITDTYNATDCYISNLEHVIVTISYKASWRGDVEFILLSASGTQSKIFRSRGYDSSTDTTTWDFMSVHTWGEDPEGEWTLTMADAYGGTTMYLYYWKIEFYGTITDPLAGTPSAGALGGPCTSSANCSALADGGCLANGKICVNCNSGYRIISDFCMQDGREGGYCDSILLCFSSSLECSNNICVQSQSDESSKIGMILGIVIGCIVVLLLIICVVYIIYKFFFVAQATATVAPGPTGYPTAYPAAYPTAYPTTRTPVYTISETHSLTQPPPYSSSQPVPEPSVYSYPAV